MAVRHQIKKKKWGGEILSISSAHSSISSIYLKIKRARVQRKLNQAAMAHVTSAGVSDGKTHQQRMAVSAMTSGGSIIAQ